MNRQRLQASLISAICTLLMMQGAGVFPGGKLAMAAPSNTPAESQVSRNIRALSDKGIYWYERFRFDLAAQAFNRILLIEPGNASALRWQGLTDLASGDLQAANIWLTKMESLHRGHPFTIELQQAISLATDRRQQFAELRYLANSERRPVDLGKRLQGLFQRPPLGGAAVQIYRLMSRNAKDRVYVRQQLGQLAKQFPQDRRYRALLAELGGGMEEPRLARATKPKAAQPTPTSTETSPVEPPQVAAGSEGSSLPSTFEQGQQLADRAQKLSEQGNKGLAIALLQDAVALNPTYPWFRYDLATLLDEQGTEAGKLAADKTMREGLAIEKGPEMHFATALLLARQGRSSPALELLEAVPVADWTAGMTALEKRITYGEFLGKLRAQETDRQYNALASSIARSPRWRAEPEVQALELILERKAQAKIGLSHEQSLIDGEEGVSRLESREIPVQLEIPLDFERKLFFRADSLHARAGKVNPATSSNFAKLGTTLPNDPSIDENRLTQDYRGHVVGVGVETDVYRLDIGTTTGDFPVNDWVGGLQWQTSLGAGSLRLELARRMVNGSVLSLAGAVDPLTGESWGGARRNGVSAVYYEAFSPTLDFVGIARANLITGKNMPSNTEYNLQGIVGKTVYQQPGSEVEIGASLFLWSFDKNLRFYTFGQGGYYSPQAFGSLTFPVTWTGRHEEWSWQLQARVGASESREADTSLYPGRADLAAAAAAQGNPVIQAGSPGGGTSTGLSLALERQIRKNLVLGGYVEIDRSEGYNPDRFQIYVKYSFGDFLEVSTPPQGLVPYSRF